MIEYILLIVVSITLVIGVATKLITPLRNFMQNYAGTYVECLLEMGELPYFLSSNPNPECSFDNMEASGRFDNLGSNGSSGSGSGSRSNRNSNSNSNRSNASTNASNNNSGSGSGSGSNSPRPIQGSNTGTDGSSGSEAGSGGAAGKGSSGQDKVANRSASSNNSSGSDSDYGSGQGDYGAGITGVMAVPNEMKKKEIELTPNKPIKADKSGSNDELRKSSFSAPFNEKKEKKEGPDLEGDMGFNWGAYIRYFVIGGIILALIIMVGTQINTLRKSWGTAK